MGKPGSGLGRPGPAPPASLGSAPQGPSPQLGVLRSQRWLEPMRSWNREALSHPHDPAGNKAPRVWGPAGNSPWLPSHGVPPAASGGLCVLGQVPSLLWAAKPAPVCWLPASFPLPKRLPLPGTSSFPQENLRPAVTSLCLCPILSLTLTLASIARVAPPEATGPCGVSWEPYGVSSPEQRGRGEPRLWIQPEPSPALFLLTEQALPGFRASAS